MIVNRTFLQAFIIYQHFKKWNVAFSSLSNFLNSVLRIRSRSILDSLIRIRKNIRIKECKISAKYVKKLKKSSQHNSSVGLDRRYWSMIRIYSFTWLIRIKMEHFRKFARLTKLFVFRKGKGGNPAPVPYLVTSSSEEVHFRRDKSNDNPTYKEIIIENKVGNRIDPWKGDHWNQVGHRIYPWIGDHYWNQVGIRIDPWIGDHYWKPSKKQDWSLNRDHYWKPGGKQDWSLNRRSLLKTR